MTFFLTILPVPLHIAYTLDRNQTDKKEIYDVSPEANLQHFAYIETLKKNVGGKKRTTVMK